MTTGATFGGLGTGVAEHEQTGESAHPSGALATARRHLFSVDVEEYFQVSAFERVAPIERWDGFASRVVPSTERILSLMEAHGARGTFFTVGWVAERHPSLVRAISDAGHEVASHSHLHRRVTMLDRQAFRLDVRRSREVLEQVTGRPVTGFRAPSFSIIPGTEWAWEVLVEEGFAYDSSVFPIRRPGYGNPGAPRDPYVIETPAGPLREFPMATVEFGGARLPAAGGAYLRVLPVTLVDRAVCAAAARGVPAMCYIHPWEVDPGQPRLPVGMLTRLRHYTGLRGVADRLATLLARHRFTSVRDHLAAA